MVKRIVLLSAPQEHSKGLVVRGGAYGAAGPFTLQVTAPAAYKSSPGNPASDLTLRVQFPAVGVL